jgi:hypothetical protein
VKRNRTRSFDDLLTSCRPTGALTNKKLGAEPEPQCRHRRATPTIHRRRRHGRHPSAGFAPDPHNPTVRILRIKYVPEANIAAALRNLEEEAPHLPDFCSGSCRNSHRPGRFMVGTSAGSADGDDAAGRPTSHPACGASTGRNPFAAYLGALHGVPALTAQNLIEHALRINGAPETDSPRPLLILTSCDNSSIDTFQDDDDDDDN